MSKIPEAKNIQILAWPKHRVWEGIVMSWEEMVQIW